MASSSRALFILSDSSFCIKQGVTKLRGIDVAATGGGAYTLYDNNAGNTSGTQISGTITPSAGTYIDWFDTTFRDGLSIVITGILVLTVIYE